MDKLEKVGSKIRTAYRWLGNFNLETKGKVKPKSWYGKMAARMVSLRTGLNAALLGGGILTGTKFLTEPVRGYLSIQWPVL